MFAIMIYDGDEKNCFVCRDPFGIKPLYYREEKDRVVFASEMKAFLFDEEMGGFDVDKKSLQKLLHLPVCPRAEDDDRQGAGAGSLPLYDAVGKRD